MTGVQTCALPIYRSRIGSKDVPGGTITVWVSWSCGTNWIEYYGSPQWVSKRAYSDDSVHGGATGWETDYGR